MSAGPSTGALRVLHLVTDRDRRGAQVFAQYLVRGLHVLGVHGRVVALGPGSDDDGLDVPAIGPSRRAPRNLATVRKLAREHDVVVAHGSTTLFVAATALVGTGVPFVYRQISDPLFWAGTAARRARVALMIRRAAGVVALSESSAGVLRAHYRLPVERTIVIPNAVPAGDFDPADARDARRCRRRFDCPDDHAVLLYLGALVNEKGADMAVRTMGSVSGAVLVVAGDGDRRAGLESLAERVAPGRVRFAGSIDRAVDALHAADLLVFPSRGGDSVPAALIEAGLCEVPAVATPVGSIADVVVDGRTGRLVPVGDQRAFDAAVAELVTDPGLRQVYGRAARQRCLERFTIEATAPRWRDLLTGVAGGPGRTARRDGRRRRRS